MKLAIKTWWYSLAQRERVIVSVGGILTFMLLLYFCLYSPVLTTIANEKEQLRAHSHTIAWMRQADGHIQTLQNMGFSSHGVNNQSAMALVEHALAQKKLAKTIRQVKQPQHSQVELDMKAVPFDAFINCLQQLENEFSIHILQFKAVKTNKMGVVNLQLKLEKQ